MVYETKSWVAKFEFLNKKNEGNRWMCTFSRLGM